MRKILICLLAVWGGLMSGCASGDQGAQVTEEDLQHHRFMLVSVDGVPSTWQERRPMLEFGEGFRINGQTCNSFFGQAVLKDGVMKAEQMGSTMMLCSDETLNTLERTTHEMLREGVSLHLQDGLLTLQGNGHTLVYELKDLVQ